MDYQSFANQLLHPLGDPVDRVLTHNALVNARADEVVASRKLATSVGVMFEPIHNVENF
jgi:hypothetical protein